MGGHIRGACGAHHRTLRRLAVLAVAGTTLALVGPGDAGAQEEKQQVDVEIGYLCGTAQVTLRVTATFPAQATVGNPVRLEDVTLALSVPPDALPELTAAGAVAVSSVVRLETSIVQGDTTANATWSAVDDEPVPLVEPTVFTGTVEPEPVTAGAPGDLSFTAVGLLATITGRTAEGTPTEPPSVNLTCVPAPDQKSGLAVVPVSEVEPTHPTFERPEPGIKVGTKEQRSAEAPVNALGPVPPECHPIPPPPAPTWQNLCANLAGYSNVEKLRASVLQPVSLVNIAAGRIDRNCGEGIWCFKNTVLPELDGEPNYKPAPASFFAFGFVPITGTMQLTQLGIGKVDIWFLVADNKVGEAKAQLQVSVRLFDAAVNGVPLDLGPDCRTVTPIDVVLTATPDTYSIAKGGVLTGTIDIPPFTGCGVTEDLDSIITGLVSGPNNYVKMTQGPVCTINNANQCPPEEPIPEHGALGR